MKMVLLNLTRVQLLMALFFALILIPRIRASADWPLERPGLVSTGWLAEHLDKPDLRVIDARAALSAYVPEHIPEAVYLNTETVRFSEGGTPARLFSPDRIADIIGGLGIGNDHTVVIYSSGDEAFAHAAYVAYLLEWLGHSAIGVLDGGFEKWKAEGRPVTRDLPSHPPARFEARVNADLLREANEVRSAIDRNSVVLLDARSPDVFQAGHIPSAGNYFLRNTVEGDEVLAWKSPDELRALAVEAGADGSKAIVTYCTSGRESAQIWFTLRHVAGFENVSSYHGSMIDWTAKGLPVK